jgi:ADA HAT complex component 1
MFRFPSWISESRGSDRVVDEKTTYPMAHAFAIPRTAEEATLKRKRDDEGFAPDELSELPEVKRVKSDSVDHGHVKVESDGESWAGVDDQVEDAASKTSTGRLRETIESQISLEILLKHDELRLINQELAKCQVALEQLRRCHLMPYPTNLSNPMSMQTVSNGSGPALEPAQGEERPPWAPPYGIMDGPYARHYAKWLIPDPAFDGWHAGWSTTFTPAGKTIPEGRTTRHSFAEGGTPASKARAGRLSTGSKLQALPAGYPQPKGKAGPCILKRADGQSVKLVCIDCNREDFSSTQGFINHCRIAHKRDYKSHEEAAVACGQPIDVDDLNTPANDDKAAVVATGLVHPLIRSAPTDREAYTALLSRIEQSMSLYNSGKLAGVTAIPTATPKKPSQVLTPTPSPHFVPSPATPHLSALLASKGFNRDLSQFVASTTAPLDLEDFAHSSGTESELDSSAPRPLPVSRRVGGIDGASDRPTSSSSGMRMPARAGMSPAPLARPGSSKGISPRPAYATPINTGAGEHLKPKAEVLRSETQDINTATDSLPEGERQALYEHILNREEIDLSPATVASTSNNAPSLVSDDGDFDGFDDGKSSIADSEVEDLPDSGDSEIHEIDIEEDGEGGVRGRERERIERVRLGKEGKKRDGDVKRVSFVREDGR